MIISASLYVLTLGAIQSINGRDGFFNYLYSVIIFTIGISLFTYFVYSFEVTLQEMSFNLSMLWLLASIISLIILIIFSIQKKSIVKPALVSGISFAAFSIVFAIYASTAIF